MSKTQILIVSIGTPILLAAIALLFYLVFLSLRQKKNYQKIKHILDYVSSSTIKSIEVILNRISIINRKNPSGDIVTTYEGLSNQFDDINRKYKILKAKIQQLKDEYKKMSPKDLKNELEIVEELKISIESRIKKFKKKAEKITQQEDFLRNEFAFYRNNLNQVLHVYAKKRVLLDKIAPKIDLVNDSIKSTDEKFISNIENANIEKATELINEYRNGILVLAKAINEGAKIQVHLYKIIPNQIADLIAIHKMALDKLKIDLSYLNFKETIQKLALSFKEAKRAFLNIEIDKAKRLVIKILKNIKIIEKMVNLEVKARNLYMKNYNEVIKLIKVTLKEYVSIKKQLKTMTSQGEEIPYEVTEIFNNVRGEVAIIDELATSFKELISNNEIPFTSKLSRTKIIMNKSIGCLKNINGILNILWVQNADRVELKNKYLKINSALNSIQEVQKIDKIILSKEEMKEMKNLIDQKNKSLDNISMSNIDIANAKYEMDILTEFVSSYYKVVMGKSKMASMIKNLIQDFGYERAENQSLNIIFSLAEQKYMEGKYLQGLSLIIQGLEERGENV